MRIVRLLGGCLVAMLAVAAITASGALAKKTLVLKEAGVPLAAGAEVAVELETSLVPGCLILFPKAELLVNGSKVDEIQVAPLQEPFAACKKSPNDYQWARIFKVTMTVARKTRLLTYMFVEHGPGSKCIYEITKWMGTFPVPGSAVSEGSAIAKLQRHESAKGCAQSVPAHFLLSVQGHNGKPLETERVG